MQAVERIILGWLVGKIIIIILIFRVSTSKNKNIDDGVKETCATLSTQVNMESTTGSKIQQYQVHEFFAFLCILS